MNIKEFIQECRKRTIFRSISIYVVSIWVIIQVAATTFPYIGLPTEAVSLVIICGLIGFPLIMIFSWYYNVIPEQKGKIITLHPESDHPDKSKDALFRRTFFLITALVSIGVLVVIGIIISKNLAPQEALSIVVNDDGPSRIAVLTFQNNTGDSNLDIIGEMAADRIAHSITRNNIATVVSNDIYEDYSEIFKKGLLSESGNLNVQEYLEVAQMITGNYYVDKEQILIDCNIIDARDGRIIKALETITALKTNPLAGVEKLKQAILGYLATTASTPQLFIETHTPKFDAYRHLLQAKADVNAKNQLSNLEKAIAIDSAYFEPKLLRLSLFYNRSEYETVDSLYTILQEETIEADARQINLLAFYKSLLEGNNRKVYEHYLTEYNFAPFDMPSNLTMMVLALQFVNKPEKTIEIYNDIPQEGLNFTTCSRCALRAYVYVMSHLELGNFDEALLVLEDLIRADDDLNYNRLWVQANCRTRKWSEIAQHIEKKTVLNPSYLMELYLAAGQESVLMDEPGKAREFYEKALSSVTSESDSLKRGQLHYYLGNMSEALSIFNSLVASDEKNTALNGWLGATYMRLGLFDKGKEVLNKLNSLDRRFQFGAVEYALARIRFAEGDRKQSLTLLQRSVAEGIRFRGDTFQNDPYFVTLQNEPSFRDILTFWH